MKKLQITGWLVACLWVVLLAGCKKEPINSDIEQHWKYEQFTIRETGEVVKCERLFMGFMGPMVMVSEKQGPNGYGEYRALKEYRDHETVLVLKRFRGGIGEDGTGIVPTPEELMPYGIINPEETVFRIVHVSSKRLVLESDYARLELKKF